MRAFGLRSYGCLIIVSQTVMGSKIKSEQFKEERIVYLTLEKIKLVYLTSKNENLPIMSLQVIYNSDCSCCELRNNWCKVVVYKNGNKARQVLLHVETIYRPLEFKLAACS